MKVNSEVVEKIKTELFTSLLQQIINNSVSIPKRYQLLLKIGI